MEATYVNEAQNVVGSTLQKGVKLPQVRSPIQLGEGSSVREQHWHTRELMPSFMISVSEGKLGSTRLT